LTTPEASDITASMDAAAECTHCGVVMTSWSAQGSPIRYYQCPFCARTHSSLYGEVFRRGAGARLLASRPSTGDGIPEATPQDIRWAGIKATAARWFARLDAEGQRHGPPPRRAVPSPRAPRKPLSIPLADARDVVELTPEPARARKKA
jgi:hypothetical protein